MAKETVEVGIRLEQCLLGREACRELLRLELGTVEVAEAPNGLGESQSKVPRSGTPMAGIFDSGCRP